MSTFNSKILRTRLAGELTILQFIKNYAEHITRRLRVEKACSPIDAGCIQERVLNTPKKNFGGQQVFNERKLWQAVDQYVDKELQMLENTKHKNFGLSEAAFNDLLEALQRGDNSLFEQTFLAHFGDCMAYLKQRFKATHADAYDATMDAMLEFCHRLKDGKVSYGNLRFLFTQMAGQIYLKWIKKQQVTSSAEGLEVPDLEVESFDQKVYDDLDKAWNMLCEDCQSLLKGFYYGKMSLREMAKELGRSDVALRKQKQRCVEKLRAYFKQFYQ